MFIRRFRESDAEIVSALIIRTERITNSKDYSEEWTNAFEKRVQPFTTQNLLKRLNLITVDI